MTAEGIARRDAFVTAAEGRGMKCDVVLSNQLDPDLSAYTSENRPHTAIVGFSDTQAGGILVAAKALGIRVPEDIRSLV